MRKPKSVKDAPNGDSQIRSNAAPKARKGVSARYFQPDFNLHPLNEVELTLEPLEKSWVDFLYGARGCGRYIRAEGRPGMRCYGLEKLHRLLNEHKQQVAEGNRAAIFHALARCAEENVPLPYWLADEIIAMSHEVARVVGDGEPPRNLHELFGLECNFPADGKKAITKRRDAQLRKQLWLKVHELMRAKAQDLMQTNLGFTREQAIERARSVGHDGFIKEARKLLAFPYSQRKSRDMFDEQERVQSRYLNASKGRAVPRAHRIK